MLTRKKACQKQEKDWFYFSSGLFNCLCSDYIALRLLYQLEPLTTALTILVKMIEVAEKSLKLYVSVRRRSSTALSDAGSEYGHDIEKLRKVSASYDPVFAEEDIKKFAKDLSDKSGKLYQFLRYGSEETTQAISADLARLMPVIDRIFFKSILLLPNDERRVLIFSSALKALVTRSHFDQSQNPVLLLAAMKENNAYFDEYVEYCHRLDAEYSEQLEQFRSQTRGG